MASGPDLKISRCVEWITEILHGIRPWISPKFIFQGRPCFLMLYAKNPYKKEDQIGSHYFLYVCGAQKLTLPLTVKVLVENDTFPSLMSCPIKTIYDQSDCIWSCSASKFNEHCKRDYVVIANLCFRVMFYENDNQPNLDDKSVQTPSYIDTNFQLEGISKDFSTLFDESPNYDTEFICGHETIKAHKNVLCCRSEVFASMLRSDMTEGKTGQVKISDVDGAIFREFMRYLYTGSLPELTVDIALRFYEIADKYAVDSLKKQCASFLVDNMSVENVCEVLIIADQHNDPELRKTVMEYMIERKIPRVVEKWTDFCKENPVLANEVLNLFLQSLC